MYTIILKYYNNILITGILILKLILRLTFLHDLFNSCVIKGWIKLQISFKISI